MLRTPYRQRVAPWRDRPDLEVWIDWYPASPEAKVLPFATAFNSNLFQGDWQDREGVGPVGYVGTNNWARTKIGAHGQYPCLTEEEAAEGFDYDPAAECERRTDGLPLCCGLEIFAFGGAWGNGYSDFQLVETCIDFPGSPVKQETYVGPALGLNCPSDIGSASQWWRASVQAIGNPPLKLKLLAISGGSVIVHRCTGNFFDPCTIHAVLTTPGQEAVFTTDAVWYYYTQWVLTGPGATILFEFTV